MFLDEVASIKVVNQFLEPHVYRLSLVIPTNFLSKHFFYLEFMGILVGENFGQHGKSLDSCDCWVKFKLPSVLLFRPQ